MGKIPILTNIFQMGWNHEPDKGILLWRLSARFQTSPSQTQKTAEAEVAFPLGSCILTGPLGMESRFFQWIYWIYLSYPVDGDVRWLRSGSLWVRAISLWRLYGGLGSTPSPPPTVPQKAQSKDSPSIPIRLYSITDISQAHSITPHFLYTINAWNQCTLPIYTLICIIPLEHILVSFCLFILS